MFAQFGETIKVCGNTIPRLASMVFQSASTDQVSAITRSVDSKGTIGDYHITTLLRRNITVHIKGYRMSLGFSANKNEYFTINCEFSFPYRRRK